MPKYAYLKDELKNMSVVSLKQLAEEINKDIPKSERILVSKYRKVAQKEAFADIIWEKWGGDEGWEIHKKTSPIKPDNFSDTDSTKDDSDTPKKKLTPPKKKPFSVSTKDDSDTPNEKSPPPPKKKPISVPTNDDFDTPNETRPHEKKLIPRRPPEKKPIPRPPNKKSIPVSLEKLEFDFVDSNIMDSINIKLEKYTPGAPEPPDADDISPEELIELVKEDDFCIKVAQSLKDIYKAKLEKYQKLQKKTLQSITNDTTEKNEMFLTSGIEKQELDRLFPMITINTAFLIKLKTLYKLAVTKGIEYNIPNNRRVIDMVRENLLEAITDKEDGILSVTGVSRVKIRNQLCKTLYILSKGYRPFMDSFLNLVFTGPAGVGKTKLAKTYAFVFEKAGILLRGDLIVASPKDMVGEYVGHTAIKSAGVLMKGLEGVILIDEAYQIMPCSNGVLVKDSKTFGPEAITEIVNFLDKYMGMSIIIVAGYEKEMENCFFGANEGLNRRFPNRISIPSYSNSDLLSIFINGVNTKIGENIFTEEIVKYIFTIIVKLSRENSSIFGNQAGDMVNLSSMFLNSYYGSVKIIWGSFDHDILIVNSTFNQFLRNKGYLAVFPS